MKRLKVEEGTWLHRQVSSSFLFLTGLAVAPAVIIQDNLVIKLLQLILFMSLSYYSGKRIILLGSLIFLLSTLIFNLLSPLGKVMAEIGPFQLTEGALDVGLSKGLTVICLMYLSRFCVHGTLILPGSFGRYISKTLFYLNCLVEEQKSISRKDIFGSLDVILDKVYKKKEYKQKFGRERNSLSGILILIIILSFNWGSVFFL
ncbi:hypothetical protein ES703_83922 [subsurface metagenome]